MHRNAGFLETHFIAPGNLAGNMEGGFNGQWKSLQRYGRITVVLISASAGRAGASVALTLQQAKDDQGTDLKNLNFTEIAVSQAAALNTQGFTVITSDPPDHNHIQATAGEGQLIWAVEIDAGMLDLANGFTHVRGQALITGGTPAPASAQIIYIMGNPAHARRPAPEPNTGA